MAPGTEARASWGAEALQRAVHGDGEVAAAELVGVAWRGKQGSSARGSGSRRSLGVPRVAVGEAGAGLRPSSVAGGAELCRQR